ncbi:MAG: DUF3149 domain-containing protein [Pseudomonadota bacterium]|jgi:hypothetical protein
MDAIRELFTTDIGLLSVFTIVFATAFVIYVYNFAKKHMEEDAKNAAKK